MSSHLPSSPDAPAVIMRSGRMRKVITNLIWWSGWVGFGFIFVWVIVQMQRQRVTGTDSPLSILWTSIATGTIFTNTNAFILPSDWYYSDNGAFVRDLFLQSALIVGVALIIPFLLFCVGGALHYRRHGKLLPNSLLQTALRINISQPRRRLRYVMMVWQIVRLFEQRGDNALSYYGDRRVATRMSMQGNTVIVTQSMPEMALPWFVVDPVGADRMGRYAGRQLALPARYQFVTDHTTLSHVRLFTESNQQAAMLDFFDGELRAYLIKQLRGVTVLSDGASIAFLLNRRSVGDAAQLERRLQAMERFTLMCAQRQSKALSSARPPQLRSYATVPLPFGATPRRSIVHVILLLSGSLLLLLVGTGPRAVDMALLLLLISSYGLSLALKRLERVIQRTGV